MQWIKDGTVHRLPSKVFVNNDDVTKGHKGSVNSVLMFFTNMHLVRKILLKEKQIHFLQRNFLNKFLLDQESYILLNGFKKAIDK